MQLAPSPSRSAMSPTSGRASARRRPATSSAAPPSARSSVRDVHVSERRASRSMLRDGPSSSFTSIPRSARYDSETPTRSRLGGLSSARRSTIDFMQTQGNAMKVYVRVRPYSERELAQTDKATHSTVRIDAENPAMITVLDPNKDFRPVVTYKFTSCFWSVFERKADDARGNQAMAGIRDTVDTYLNSGATSARRARAQSLVSRSAREPMDVSATNVSAPYQGSGSGAAVVDTNVSHPPYAGQADVYEKVGLPILTNTLEGYNGCVFAYGQTGSGKTFTMMGYAPAPKEFRRRRESLAPTTSSGGPLRSGEISPRLGTDAGQLMDMPSFVSQSGTEFNRNDSPQVIPMEDDDGEDVVDKASMDPLDLMGIIPRISADLYAGLRAKREKDASWSYRVEVTYYEIYNEKVFDLIKPARSADLKIRNHPTNGPYVDGLASKVCAKEEDVMRVIRNGIQERHTAQTKFNDRSSRSHAILSFNLLQLSLDGSDNTVKMQSKLNLVDLAGSERAGAAGVDRPEYREGVNINLSLTVLGRVIDCLADLSQNKSLAVPVPYRDSTLTLLLMDSLGGNSQTSMVATISPHMINFEEIKQTLRYASRATVIVNHAVINEDPQVRQIKLLTAEVERLQQRLHESGGLDYSNEDIRAMERKIKALERKVAEQERIIAGLRAELERAGITDPTLEDSFAEGAIPQSARDRKREEAMSKKLDAMQAELVTQKAAAERRASTDADQIAALKKTVARQEKTMERLKLEVQAMRQRSLLFLDRAATDLSIVFSYVTEKENSFFQNCWALMLNTNSEASDVLTRMKRENEDRLRELRRQNEDDIRELEGRFEQRLKEARDGHLEQQNGLLAKHKDALAAIEAQMQTNRSIHDEERRRLEAEVAELRRQGADAAARAREQYQLDLEKLRKKLEDGAGDRRGGDTRLLQEQHAKEVDRLNDELDRLKQARDAEVARLKQQLENEQLRRESDMMEKDRQRRQGDVEISNLRRELLALQGEKNRMEKEYQDQIHDLVVKQEELISISNSLLADWENRSSDMEGQMCKLRALIYDKDYINFRQKMRDLAFTERTDFSKEISAVEERKRRQAAALNSIREKLKTAAQSQESTYDRYSHQLNVARTGNTPPPEHLNVIENGSN